VGKLLGRWKNPQDHVRYYRDGALPAGTLANAVRILSLADENEALNHFVNRILRRQWGPSVREFVAPDLKTISGWLSEIPAARPVYRQLRDHCLAELQAATAEPVVRPSDWRRDAPLTCKCADCRALAAFLEDPTRPEGRFPLAEQRRRHLHGEIDRFACDCAHEMERKGSPYTLVCRKTLASYQRREKQFEEDVKLLKELEELAPSSTLTS
jgi:hypothetical protein